MFDIVGHWESIDVVPKIAEDGEIVESMEIEETEENAEEDSDCVVMENSSFHEWTNFRDFRSSSLEIFN